MIWRLNTPFISSLILTTSTSQPNSSCRWAFTAACLKRLGFISTQTSTSLSSLCSFFAKEPKRSIEFTPKCSFRYSLDDLSLSIVNDLSNISVYFSRCKYTQCLGNFQTFQQKSNREHPRRSRLQLESVINWIYNNYFTYFLPSLTTIPLKPLDTRWPARL